MKKLLLFVSAVICSVFYSFAELPDPVYTWDGEGGEQSADSICGKPIYNVNGKVVTLENIPAKSFTFSMFVNAKDVANWLDLCGFADQTYQFKLEVNSNKGCYVYGSEQAGLYAGNSPVFVPGFCELDAMQLLTVVQNEGRVKIYVDGVLRAITHTTTTWNALFEGDSKMKYFAWGCSPSTGGGVDRSCNLKVADVRIYDTALDSSQVNDLWSEYNNLTKVSARVEGTEPSLLTGLQLAGGENTIAEITLANLADFTIDGSMTFKMIRLKSTGDVSITVAEGALAKIGAIDCSEVDGIAVLKFETISSELMKVFNIEEVRKIGESDIEIASSNRSFFSGRDFTVYSGSVTITNNAVLTDAKRITVDGSAELISTANDPLNQQEDYAEELVLQSGGVFSSFKHARLPENVVFSAGTSKILVADVNGNEWSAVGIRNVDVLDNANAILERSDNMLENASAGFHLWRSVITVGVNSKMLINAPLLRGCDGNGQGNGLTGLRKLGPGTLEISAPTSAYKLPADAVISIEEGSLELNPTSAVDIGSATIAIGENTTFAVIGDSPAVLANNNITGSGQIKVDGNLLNIASCDLSGFTGAINLCNGATIIMAAGDEGTMTVPQDCKLKLVLSQVLKDQGYASRANGSVVFLDTDGETELTEGVFGNEYNSSTPCWTPTASNQDMNDSSLWNMSTPRTSGEVLFNCSQVGDISVEIPEGTNFETITIKGSNNTVKLVYKAGRNNINNTLCPVIALDGAKFAIVIDATEESVVFNSDWLNYIRTSGYNFIFRGAGEFAVSLQWGLRINAAIQSHLVFESGEHAMSFGYDNFVGESNFGEGATAENPTILVENGAVLNLTGKDLCCWSGSANNKGIIRVNNGGRLNIGSGGSTCYYRQQFYLEPGATLDASGVRSNYFRLQGGSGEDASPVIYVPASDAGDELPARIIASTGIYLANDQTRGFKVQVEEGSKLLIDGNIAAAGTSDDFIVRKVGAGNLEITGSIAPKIIVNGGKVVFGGDVGNGYMTNVAGMHIKGGEARISASDRGVGGSIVVDKGATLVLNSTDVINYSGTTELHVYGTFDGTNQRQSLGSNNKVYFYDGAYLKGAGGNNYYSGYTAVFDVIANSVFVVEGNVYVDAAMGISGDLTFKSKNGGVVYMANPVSTKGTENVGVDNVVMLIASSAQSGKTATIPEGSWGAQYKLNEGVTVEFVEGRLVFNAPALAPEIVLAQGMAFAQTGSAGPLTVLNGAAVMVDGNPVANYTAKATANVLKFIKPAFVIRVR